MPKEEGGSKACHPPAAAWDLVRGWMGRGEGKERGGGRNVKGIFRRKEKEERASSSSSSAVPSSPSFFLGSPH